MQNRAFLFYYRLMHWLLLYCSVSSFEAIFAPFAAVLDFKIGFEVLNGEADAMIGLK